MCAGDGNGGMELDRHQVSPYQSALSWRDAVQMLLAAGGSTGRTKTATA